jgi:uncharacterized membrane protein YphA (DoxX/SURF4 family)
MNDSQKLGGWQNILGWTCAGVMALLWIVAGLYKLSDIGGFQVKLSQLLFPTALTLPATLAVATSELFAGVLLLRPAWRRLGGLVSTGLLLAFMAYMAVNYTALQGEDCSCFPWLERAVGPAFFWSDGAMMAASLIAAWFAPRMVAVRQTRFVLFGIIALATVALGFDKFGPESGTDVPATVVVEGQDYNLRQGKVFLYFFNPTCLHCLAAGKELSKYTFPADFVGVPTQDFDFGAGFLEDAGLTGMVKLSPDLDKLKETFPFNDVPYAAAIEDGKVLRRYTMIDLEEPEMGRSLRELGVVK